MSNGPVRIPGRSVIYTKDIQNITGRKLETARKLLSKIRRKLNKPRGSYITVQEFCMFMNLNEEFVRSFLK